MCFYYSYYYILIFLLISLVVVVVVNYYNYILIVYSPWEVFLIEFLVSLGWVPGFLYPELGFGTLVQRFRCHWVHFLKAAFPAIIEELSACKLLSPFGLSSVRSFGIHLIPGCKKKN